MISSAKSMVYLNIFHPVIHWQDVLLSSGARHVSPSGQQHCPLLPQRHLGGGSLWGALASTPSELFEGWEKLENAWNIPQGSPPDSSQLIHQKISIIIHHLIHHLIHNIMIFIPFSHGFPTCFPTFFRRRSGTATWPPPGRRSPRGRRWRRWASPGPCGSPGPRTSSPTRTCGQLGWWDDGILYKNWPIPSWDDERYCGWIDGINDIIPFIKASVMNSYDDGWIV